MNKEDTGYTPTEIIDGVINRLQALKSEKDAMQFVLQLDRATKLLSRLNTISLETARTMVQEKVMAQ